MPKFPFLHSISAPILLLTFVAVSGANAQPGSNTLQQRLKTSLNAMVQDVREAESPAAKRQILERFVGKAQTGAQLAKALPFLTEEKRAALNGLQDKFGGYAAELQGGSGPGTSQEGVAEGDLDAFASYMQQDLEQAANGVYLSAGAIIIVLLILLILL